MLFLTGCLKKNQLFFVEFTLLFLVFLMMQTHRNDAKKILINNNKKGIIFHHALESEVV